jgi:ribosome-associated protein
LDTIEKTAQELVKLLEDMKATDVVSVDLRGKSSLADFYVIASVDNTILLDTARSKIEDLMWTRKFRWRNNLEEWRGGWLIMDFGDIVANVFLEEKRKFYNLEEFLMAGNFDLNEIENVAGTGK